MRVNQAVLCHAELAQKPSSITSMWLGLQVVVCDPLIMNKLNSSQDHWLA